MVQQDLPGTHIRYEMHFVQSFSPVLIQLRSFFLRLLPLGIGAGNHGPRFA